MLVTNAPGLFVTCMCPLKTDVSAGYRHPLCWHFHCCVHSNLPQTLGVHPHQVLWCLALCWSLVTRTVSALLVLPGEGGEGQNTELSCAHLPMSPEPAEKPS